MIQICGLGLACSRDTCQLCAPHLDSSLHSPKSPAWSSGMLPTAGFACAHRSASDLVWESHDSLPCTVFAVVIVQTGRTSPPCLSLLDSPHRATIDVFHHSLPLCPRSRICWGTRTLQLMHPATGNWQEAAGKDTGRLS